MDDQVKYNKLEIAELLARINGGKRQTSPTPSRISAYGILGFVRFVEGYYMILITKRRKIAQIAHHSIYKIVDTQMLYIPNEREKMHSDEAKYCRMFQNIDLSSNFYFSYSYDLTHTLQYNLSPINTRASFENSPDQTIWEGKLVTETKPSPDQEIIRTQPNRKFVWNEYLISNVNVHPDWLLFVIHGFVGQADICVFGRPIYLTLIARRSKKFAGTRFLKRGASLEGNPANEVETEQIVFDASISSFDLARFTSFVQIRGSVPSHWSQDSFKVVPKPTIELDFVDPYYRTAGIHFNELFYRYGSPVIIFNLVKKRERKPQESLLSQEFKDIISYLNQFLPQEHHLIYCGLDMARMNKSKDMSVMGELSTLGYRMIKLTGLFVKSLPKNLEKMTFLSKLGGQKTPNGQILQTGVVRVNCVDCLDRTNTAQFALGKCALAFQLYILGVIDEPTLEFDTDAVRMLEQVYEDHGDTLALQYGGSQLVHRIKTYRKIAPLSSQSRDIMQTLSRYYSNTFSDAEKQNTINLFLGLYKPYENPMPIWELETDFYLHNSKALDTLFGESFFEKSLTCWWDKKVAQCLPRAGIEIYKGEAENILYRPMISDSEMTTDGFSDQYRPQDLTLFANHLLFEISHTEKDNISAYNSSGENSPFRVRQKYIKKKEPLSKKQLPPNPSVSGYISIYSNTDDSDSVSDQSVDAISIYSNQFSCGSVSGRSLNFGDSFELKELIYGNIFHMPKPGDIQKYNKYVSFGVNSGEFKNRNFPMENFEGQSTSLKDAFFKSLSFSNPVKIPPKESIYIYEEYVDKGLKGPLFPSEDTLNIYQSYLQTV